MRFEQRDREWDRIIHEIYYPHRNISSVLEMSKEVNGMETTFEGFKNLDMVLVVISPTV